jgi:hypothetical protein
MKLAELQGQHDIREYALSPGSNDAVTWHVDFDLISTCDTQDLRIALTTSDPTETHTRST